MGLQVQEMKEKCHGKVRNVPGQLSHCAPETGQPGACQAGIRPPRVGWLPCLSLRQVQSSLACTCGLSAAHTLTWQLPAGSVPGRPLLGIRPQRRPPGCAGLQVTPRVPSALSASGWAPAGPGTAPISLSLQVPVPHPSGAQCWKAPQLFTSYYNPCAEDGPATHRENMTHHSNSENPRQTGTQNLHLLMPCPEHFLLPTPWLSWSWSLHHHRGSPLPRDLT